MNQKPIPNPGQQTFMTAVRSTIDDVQAKLNAQQVEIEELKVAVASLTSQLNNEITTRASETLRNRAELLLMKRRNVIYRIVSGIVLVATFTTLMVHLSTH